MSASIYEPLGRSLEELTPPLKEKQIFTFSEPFIFTKDNRHHVCAEHRPDEVGDKVLAHVRLKHQDKLVKSATENVTSFSRTGLVTLRGTADTALWSCQDKELHRLRRCECSGAHWGTILFNSFTIHRIQWWVH